MKIIYELEGRVCVVNLPPDAQKVAVVHDDAVPADRTYREAWKHEGTCVIVDPVKKLERYGVESSEMSSSKGE